VLVAAGVLGDQASDEADPEAVARVLGANSTGPAAVMTAFARSCATRATGRLVVLSSVAGVRVAQGELRLRASKAGLDAFAQGMAEALRGSGASLMIVRPGWWPPDDRRARPRPLRHHARTGGGRRRGGRAGAFGPSVVWSPGPLRLVFAVMKLLPAALWRRLRAEPTVATAQERRRALMLSRT